MPHRRAPSPLVVLAGRVLPLLAALAGGTIAAAADADATLEPAKSAAAVPRKPERDRWEFNRAEAEVTPTGALAWKPEPFAYAHGATVKHIDFAAGSDDGDGSQAKPWKHHPWDPAATGAAKAHHGPTTYVFKRGVVYRGELHPTEDGTDADPIRLTSDPAWGTGEAAIVGSERIAHWTKGADRADIPDADDVWWADLDFAPRNVWVGTGDDAVRVELARTPNWSVTDPEEVKSNWWRFQQPEWWTQKLKIDFGGHRAHLGVDAEHLTQPADYYVGAVARVEYGIVMGTPFPTRVEGFDAGRKGIVFQGIWLGDSETITANCHYFLEDKPQYLDAAGEFWFDKKGDGGRLYLRLPKDADPNGAPVEVAKRIDLIEAAALRHVAISGLSFRWTNTYWDLTQPGWGHADVDNAAIRVRGPAVDVRIAGCRFADVAKAVRIDAGRDQDEFDRVVIADNDIERTDHGALTVRSHSAGDVQVLRNRLRVIGLRTFRQDHSHALEVGFPATMTIAGNILERCTGAGIFVFGGKGSGDERDVPLARNLVHHNSAVQTLLSANDWGGIETWQGGPFYNYSNISGDPNGRWWAFDPNKPGSARLGFAYYHDGGFKNYDFNEVAYGNSAEWNGPLACAAAFYEATPTIGNALFNSTVSRFMVGSMWSPAGARHLFLGNVFDQIGDVVFDHGQLKEDQVKTVAGDYQHDGVAYGRNVFSGLKAGSFARYGRTFATPADMAAGFVERPALAGDVGTLAAQSPLRDPDHHDFRPKPGSPVVDHGVKVFVPWGLARTVGEWQFRCDHVDPTRVLDDHWYMTPYHVAREHYFEAPVNDLRVAGATEKDYVAGPLEDWTNGALNFDGKRVAVLSHADMTKAYTYPANDNKTKTAQGADLATPDIGATSLLIEAYLQTRTPGTVLLAKRGAAAGYELAINRAGGVTFTVASGGATAAVASGAKIADGAWHHVVAELDRAAKTLVVYTDGVKTATAACALPAEASLANDADFTVGKGPHGAGFVGALDFLRIARASLAESRTSIEELYDWELDGPFLRDFAGRTPTGKGRDAGAYEVEGR